MRSVGFRFLALLAGAAFLCGVAAAQETRSAIFGRVLDPQSSGVPGAAVLVTNVDTGTLTRLLSNETGYYEANLLIPGNYQVIAEAKGFKKILRTGIVLPISTRREVDLTLEIGAISESITVEANATMLDTSSISSGRVLDNHDVMDLPTMGNNAVVLAKLTPGMETSGVNNYLGLHSNLGASDYQAGGNVGGNDWTIDGAPNVGQQRRMAYLPYNDAIAEFKVETSNFDASIGHTTGVTVSMMTKSGTNDYHGTVTWQYWNQRWNGAPFFTKQNYYKNIAAARASGNIDRANQLAAQDIQLPGHSHNYAATVGGPVRIPKLFDGRNKLFFFFAFNGFKDIKTEDPSTFNRTVPTLAERTGDFSDLLLTKNAARNQIYDPLTTATDPARSGHVVRNPFSGNIIPQSRLVNPALAFYTKLMPAPNNNPTDPTQDPTNNYLSNKTPYNWDYKSFTNRFDYNATDAHRFYGRWIWENFMENRNDWTYETMPGLNANGLNRHTLNGAAGWTWTANAATVIDAQVTANEYREGNIQPAATAVKPSDVGLPAYLDARAGGMHMIPFVNIPGYTDIVYNGFPSLPNGYPALVHYRTLDQKLNVTRVHGSHSLRGGLELRQYFKTGGGGGNTSGNFSFANTYTQRTDDGFTPAGNLGLTWAAFELGMPNTWSQGGTQSLALSNPYYGVYAQDTWRISSKLTLNLGLRAEYEGGATERYNRVMGYFDPAAQLGSFASGAQAGYSAVAGSLPLTPSQFTVQGGTVYVNSNGAPRTVNQGKLMWLPRLGWAYQIDSKTVIRGGYGVYYDTLNVLYQGYDQTGYSRSTSPTFTNDLGRTWLVGNPQGGVSPLSDPFPVRADGTRFDEPVGAAFGLLAKAGRGNWNYTQNDWQHARQHRWRFGVQRQFGANLVVEVAYDGAYSNQIGIGGSGGNNSGHALSYLPANYFAFGNSRNIDAQNAMNANVPNPFNIKYFSDLKNTNPALYADMSNNGFFTSSTIQMNKLLRAFPQMNGITNTAIPVGLAKTNSLMVNLNRRFAGGFTLNVGYTMMSTWEATQFANEFNDKPYWRLSNNGRPRRLSISVIYQFPFGKGRKWCQSGIPSLLLGGWQISGSYEYQPGPLLDWNNLFFNGNLSDIAKGPHTLDQWFNTNAGFVTSSSAAPASYQARVFPTRIEGLRADMTNQINGVVQREFKVRERAALQLRLDALNIQNRSQFNGPSTDPLSTNFGKVTSQSSGINRFIQIMARIRF